MRSISARALLAGATLGLVACGPMNSSVTDGGADASPQCEVELVAPSSLSVGQGAPLRFGLTGAQARSAVSVRSMPEGAWGASDAPFDAVIVRAPYTASGAVSVTVEVTCANGGRAERRATLEVRALRWQSLATWTGDMDGPLAREYGSQWMDPSDPDRMLVYGGFVYVPQQFTPSFDWWEFSLSSNRWTRLTTMDTPPGLPGGRLALGPEAGQGLYFGGLMGQRATPQGTYRVRFARGAMPSFETLDVMSSRRVGDYQPGLVFDAPRNRYVSFCGVNTAQGNHCSVWLFDPATQRWTASDDATSESVPEGRAGMAFVHDAAEQRAVMFSGDTGGGFSEGVWQLDLTQTPPRWSAITTTGAMIPPRRNSGFAIDPDARRMLVWGGTNDGRTSVPGLWFLSLDRGHERWDRVDVPNGPRIRSSSMVVYDAARKRFVMGFGNGPQPFTDLWALAL
ncbi:MAG: hypothetical protein JNK05_32795 [Myxococcales bacterium]|nr:hypothetical protein [Myxococcales bacterium]